MRNKLSNVLWGLFFIVVGVGFAGNAFSLWHFNLFFDGWWTMFIIIPSLITIVQRGFNVGSIIGLTVGGMLFLSCNDIIGYDVLWKLIVPIILVLIGLSIIFKDFLIPKPKMNTTTSSENTQTYSAIFSGNKARIMNEKFEGCTADAIFGGVDLDLTDAIIENDVVIHCTATFGGIDIYLPGHVKVVTSSVPIFGGVSNKHRVPMDPLAPTVYVNCTCMFGGVEIK